MSAEEAIAAEEGGATAPLLQRPPPRNPFEGLDQAGRYPTSALVAPLVQTLVPGRSNVSQPRASSLVQELRYRLLGMVFCIFLTTPLAFLLLFEGTASFIEASDVRCSANDRLLILCCMLLQLCWPVCMPQFNLMLFAWVLSAVPVVHKFGAYEPARHFLLQASMLLLAEFLLVLVAAVAAVAVRPLLERLREALSTTGTDPEVLKLIEELAPGDEPADEDCVICLGGTSGEAKWLQLKCGHRFHRDCLMSWLKKAFRCPVCRLDVNSAYQPGLITAIPSPSRPSP